MTPHATTTGHTAAPPPVVIGSMCAGSVRCYAMMVRHRHVLIDAAETHLPLRHSHHRYTIAGPNGPVTLTVPLAAATRAMSTPMAAVKISEHGDWRHRHWGALYSAYGRSPYFDFIAADLHRIIVEGRQELLLDLNMAIHHLIVDFMDLPVTTTVTTTAGAAVAAGACDLRGLIGGKKGDTLPITDVPYYQLWAHRNGFVPRLSVLDLLMNEGREGLLKLVKM